MDRSSLSGAKRLVRTRMLGVVGIGKRKLPDYPIIAQSDQFRSHCLARGYGSGPIPGHGPDPPGNFPRKYTIAMGEVPDVRT